MSDAKEVNRFAVALQDLPKNMRIFSLCLRSLYAENNVGSSANKATGINYIRDKIRQDTIVYVKGIFYMSIEVVRYSQEFFEYYEGLELEEWIECLPDILKEVIEYQKCCTEVVRMHEEMMLPLKMRQDEAKFVISELHDFNKELMKKKDLIATPLLCLSAEVDQAQAVAGGKQVTINEAAIVVVSEVLIPALSASLNGLSAVAGFFNVMKEELTSFRSKGEKAVEDRKRMHYIMMKKKAVQIIGSCREFYAMIPGVRTNLRCIPEKPDDLNYVDKWLMKQQERIERKYNQTLTGQLEKLLRQCESIEGV